MWLKVIISVLILIFLFYLSGVVYRRRIYRQVDRLDQWKVDLENRPIAEELGKLKSLKLAGETEASFERWRGQWEEIVTVILPELEEELLDIEEAAFRFRFIKAQRLLQEIQEKLWHVEQTIETIKSEVEQLTQSEQGNREKMTLLHEQLQELKLLLQKHAMGLGISYPVWHDKYNEAMEWYNRFQDAQSSGNYLQAEELLNKVDRLCQELYEAIEVCPNLIRTIEHEIPRKLDEVEAAIEEMVKKGFQVAHTGAQEKLEEMRKMKHQVVAHMQNGDIEKMKAWQDHVFSGIESIYQSLEQEVENKAFVVEGLKQLEEKQNELTEKMNSLKRLVGEFKLSYSWDDDWENKYESLTKMFKGLQHTFDAIQVDPEQIDQLYPTIKPELERYLVYREEWLEKSTQFEKEIHEIRKDELEAKEESQALKRSLALVKVQLRKGNLPGTPDHVQSGLEIAQQAWQELEDSLAQQPIDMHRVQHQLKEAKAQVQSIAQVVEMVIDLAQRSERLIQYGNRFRRDRPEVRRLLEEAEQAFRQLQFREAVEMAEQALDRADQDWREKIEDQEQPMSV